MQFEQPDTLCLAERGLGKIQALVGFRISAVSEDLTQT
jgi:hypothetical protein